MRPIYTYNNVEGAPGWFVKQKSRRKYIVATLKKKKKILKKERNEGFF